MAIRYQNSPIKEAILECLAPTQHWSSPLADEIFKDAGVPGDAQVESVVDTEMRFLAPDIVQKVETHRLRAWFNERSHMYQAGQNLCAVNMLPPYTSFDQMAPMFRKLVGAFIQKGGVVEVNRLGQRYINEIVVARQDATPSQNFKIAPNFGDALLPFQINWQVEKREQLTIQAGLAVSKIDADQVTFVFDLYAMSEAFKAPTVDQLVAWQESAHAALFEIFDATLSTRLQVQLGRTNDGV